MKSYNMYDVASQAISNRLKGAEPGKVKSILLTLDPLSPKRAYLKFSRIIAVVILPRSKYVH